MSIPTMKKTWVVGQAAAVEKGIMGDPAAFIGLLRETLGKHGWLIRRSDRSTYEDHDPGDEHREPHPKVSTEMRIAYGPEHWVWCRL